MLHSLRSHRGFTLIELLIVMVVLGILFVLGLFLFNDVQKGSQNTKAKSVVRAAFVKANSGYVSGQNSYGASDAAAAAQMPPGDNLTYVTSATDLDQEGEVYVQLDDGINDLPSAGGDLASVGQQITVCAISETGITYCMRSNQEQGLAASSNVSSTTTLFVAEDSAAYARGGTVDDAVCNLPTPQQAVVPGLCGGSPTWSGPLRTAGGSSFEWGVITGVMHTQPTAFHAEATVAHPAVGPNRACMLMDTELHCKGDNTYGGVGTGSTSSSVSTMTPVVQGDMPANAKITKIAVGSHSTCAVADGDVYCWGLNDRGQLGDGTTTTRLSPTRVAAGNVPSGAKFTELAMSYGTTCGVAGGNVYCWGQSDTGALGIGGTLTQVAHTPTLIAAGAVPSGTTFSDVDVSDDHTCAAGGGQVYCWGSDGYAQLGNGATTGNQAAPVAVGGLLAGGGGATQVEAAVGASCALVNGAVYCWGYNGNGMAGNGGILGDGTWNNSNTPVAALTTGDLGGRAVTKIKMGGYQMCALAAGEGFCWGTNSSGQLGDGTTTTRNAPTAIVSASGGVQGRTLIDIAVSQFGAITVASPL